MPIFYGFDTTYLIFVIPALIISIAAQIGVTNNFNKYSKVYSTKGKTAAEVAQYILDMNNITNVRVQRVSGSLTDNFNPMNNTVNLSESVYDSTSIAAIGVAAHEVGHAIQHARGYKPMDIRRAILPITSIGSNLWLIIFMLGMLFSWSPLINAGIILFGAIVLFQLVTLPVEFDASSRAIKSLAGYGLLNEEELKGTKKVLGAAAMTYVAALVSSILHLLRLLALSNNKRD